MILIVSHQMHVTAGTTSGSVGTSEPTAISPGNRD